MIEDRTLARVFRQARREDERRAPRLADVLGRQGPPCSRRTAGALRGRLATAAVLLALLALAITSLRVPEPADLPATPDAKAFSSQSRWIGPTDFLLQPPSPELWRTTPSIGRPLPALEAGSAEPTKGART
jgi:hypothetical protein